MRNINKVFILSCFLLLSTPFIADTEKPGVVKNGFEGMLKSEFVEKYEPEFYNDEKKAYKLNNPARDAVKKVAPVYPHNAARKNETGIALVGYQVLADGTVTDIEVIEEFPSDVGFGKASVKAARNFRYQALENNNESDVTYAVNQFRFSLEPSGDTKRDMNRLLNKANTGDTESMYLIATVAPAMYGIKLEPSKNNELILSAAMLGHHPAQLNLGLRLFSGHGMKKNRTKSKNWLELSAENGNDFAIRFLEKYSNYF